MPKQFTLYVTNLIIDIVKDIPRSMVINFERRNFFSNKNCDKYISWNELTAPDEVIDQSQDSDRYRR